MKLETFLMNTISEGKNPSSKRVAGCLGWIVCILASITAMFHGIPNPEIIEMLFWSSSALLGLDTITSPFRADNKKGG